MSKTYSEYQELFHLETLQRGRPTALALSPLGRWLCSASNNGDLLVQRAARGYIYCHVGMDRLNHVTAITWATDLQIILGSSNGAVYVATVIVSPAPEENRIKITYLLGDIVSPIRALAYDFDRKLLALGYRGHASIWQRSVDKHTAQNWVIIDIFRTTIDRIATKVNTLHFFGPHKSLFVGLESGAMVWFAKGRLTEVDMGSRLCRIGATALSPDNLAMAVSTLDQSVLVCPLSSNGPIAELAQDYLLESGQEWHRFRSYTPIVFTSGCQIACGTLDGTIAIISHNGSCLQKLSYGMCSVLMVFIRHH
ncbi:hypothetical protein FRC08_012521 [Ceratobasidium sp. 394]|nr:hypothetical protein FRC08_012521 [Ceratobasidium sp. 394]